MRLTTKAAFRTLCLAVAASGFTTLGCNNNEPAITGENPDTPGVAVEKVPADQTAAPADGTTGAQTPEGEHGHEHGEHGGELVELQPGALEVEWTHDEENDKFTVWVASLQEAGKEIERAEVRVTGAGEPKVYALEKEGEDTYVATNGEMVTAIDASGGEQDALQTQLVIVSGGTEHTARLVNMHH